MYDKRILFVSGTTFSRPLPTSALCVEILFLYFIFIFMRTAKLKC